MRATYKVPGGKLVGVDVTLSADGTPQSCRIDGDFFMDSPSDERSRELLDELAETLVHGGSVADALARYPDVRMIGVDADAVERAFRRAVLAASSCGSESIHGSVAHGSVAHEVPDGPMTANDGFSSGRGARMPGRPRGSMDEAARRLRLSSLHPRIIHDHPRSPQDQMDTDERWARLAARGEMGPTLRFWEWASSAVVIGRFQSLDAEVDRDAARRGGFSVVRRCTGGGAMFIEPGNTITYSLIAPLSFVSDVTIEESYRLCDQWLVDALGDLGMDAFFSGVNDIASPKGKIGGAAQRRFPASGDGPGSVLHHVTMAYDIDARTMSRVLTPSAEKFADKAVRSAAKRVDPLRSQTGLDRSDLVARLIGSAAVSMRAVE